MGHNVLRILNLFRINYLNFTALAYIVGILSVSPALHSRSWSLEILAFFSYHFYYVWLNDIADLEIDWSKTMAWGEGGYYGRLFMNVKGREPEGIVAPEDYEKVRSELIEKIAWGLDNRKEGIIYKEWKLIKNLDDQTYELYNLENDPEEKRNLIEEKYIVDKDFADDLKKRLSSFKKERATSTTDIVKFNKEDVERCSLIN